MRLIGLSAVIQFYGNLRSLLNTGLTMDQAVLFAGERGKKPYRTWAPIIAKHCASGGRLHEGLRQQGESKLVCALIEAGELSSHTQDMCSEIVTLHEHVQEECEIWH